MEVYKRYFKVTEGPLIQRLKEIRQTNSLAHKRYKEFIKDVGAEATYWADQSGKLTALTFEKVPDKSIFKKVENGWYPKKTTKEGRDLVERLNKIKTIDEDRALEAVGIKDLRLLDGRYMYRRTITVIPSNPLVAIVTVPWYDEDPEEIKKYMLREAGTSHCESLEVQLTEFPPEFQEIKGWETEKIISEWNDSLKEAA